jgi:hypothetical protein
VFCSPAVARAVMVCHIFCSSLSHVGIAVFAFIPQVSFMLHTAIANRTQELAFIRSFRSIPLISLSGYMYFPTHKSMWLQPCSVSLHTASPPHTYTLSVHSLQYTPFVHYFQPLPFPTHRSGKKMRQTSCRQHPSTALCASCVRGTRSTRSGSHTTHRLNTSFRFSTLAFQPCYPRWLKAVFTIRFKPASPTPTPDHPPLIYCSCIVCQLDIILIV